MATFWVFNIPLKIDALYSNIISWIFAVLFAYITNRIWVFESRANTFSKYIYEIFSFFSGRLLTLGIEELIIFVFVTLLGFNSMLIKTIAQIIVIISNYIISKVFVFKK
ncbi:MAG: GtrA family protein [Clostridia bacterium]|nr:GtrA family protein [Clostridia bacterium]